MTGKLIILSGPSGVGKDTVIDQWKQRNSRVERVVAYTTRSPRPGEVHGRDYQFVDVDRFHQHARAEEFLEFKEVHGNFYATPLKDLETLLAQDKIAVLKIDVQGALSVMDLRPDAISIFLLPPSNEELERRIRGRGTDPEETIQKRLRNAHDEMALSSRYQHRIINQKVEDAVEELESIVN